CVRQDNTRNTAQWTLSTPRSERVFIGTPTHNDGTNAGQVCFQFLVVGCRVAFEVPCVQPLAVFPQRLIRDVICGGDKASSDMLMFMTIVPIRSSSCVSSEHAFTAARFCLCAGNRLIQWQYIGPILRPHGCMALFFQATRKELRRPIQRFSLWKACHEVRRLLLN